MTRIRRASALLAAVVLAACSKDGVQIITEPTAGSFIKFYHFGLNAPVVNFFANDTKVTAISSTSCTPPTVPPNPACATTGVEATTGTAYGALGNAGLYSSLPPGQYAFSARIAIAPDNGFQVSKISSTLAAGKHYSLFTSGFYDATAKTTDAFVVEDNFSEDIDFTKSSARLVNASSNSSPMTIYAKNTVSGDSVLVASSIAYKAGGVFTSLPAGVYDLTVRYAGSNTAQIVRTGVSFTANHTYTVAARGDMTVVSTTAATRPTLDVTPNR
ncbi:MAG: DUF4397 domain-containing protein [bacterium]